MPPIHEVTKASCRTGTGMPANAIADHASRLPRHAHGPGGPELGPGGLFGDLWTFAEAHHLPVHGSQVIKDRLRRGFWQHVRSDRPARAE